MDNQTMFDKKLYLFILYMQSHIHVYKMFEESLKRNISDLYFLKTIILRSPYLTSVHPFLKCVHPT